ncbi:MAG: CDP-alcohol phosphatidyltransferase family protein [Bacteroidia bacterium]
MTRIPRYLIFARLIIGLFFLFIPFSSLRTERTLMISLLITGILTDIFDGIIARKLNVSDEKLRRMDSLADQIFWICILVCTFFLHPYFFLSHKLMFTLLIGLEASTYAVSFLKFGKEVSTHAILSKIWTLSMLAFFIELIATGYSGPIFITCFLLGLISRLEIILILLVLKEWTTDVPSLRQAIRLRQGKAMKRNKMFNG